MGKNLNPILEDGTTIYDDEDWGDEEDEHANVESANVRGESCGEDGTDHGRSHAESAEGTDALGRLRGKSGDASARSGESAEAAVKNAERPAEGEKVEAQDQTQQSQQSKPEVKHLSHKEKQNIIIGLAILLAVGTALVRFFTY